MLKWTRQQGQLQRQQQLLYATVEQLPKQSFQKYFLKRNIKLNFSSQESFNIHKTTTLKDMPTMTQTLERRLHRRSLDNQLDHQHGGGRHNFSSQANKENFGVHFMHSPCGNSSLTALHDLSNSHSSPRMRVTSGRRRQTLGGEMTTLQTKRRLSMYGEEDTRTPSPRTRPQHAERFSDDFADANDETPLSHLKFHNADTTLSSSRMGDTTLDRMLDAIIESARKDMRRITQQQQVEAAGDDWDYEASIHEMEVRTPTHLKRQRVVRRKRSETAAKRSDKATRTPAVATDTTPQHLLCGREVVDTPQHCTKQQHCSTPTLEETQSIKRCLSFSPPSDDDDADYSAAKRGSVASSNASSTCDAQLSCGQNSSSSSSSTAVVGVKGALDVAIFVEREQLNVHVIRCRDLQRSNGSTALNAYVKVALIQRPLGGITVDPGFQRTAVHRHSSRPYFDHRFKFDLRRRQEVTLTKAAKILAAYDDDDDERLQLAVWHRDRQLKRSEFLGCMSFPLQSLLQQPVNGSYKLQSQACLNKPQPAVPAAASATTVPLGIATATNLQQQQQHTTTNIMATTTTMPTRPPTKPNQNITTNNNNNNSNNNNNDDGDVISIDSMAQAIPSDIQQPQQPIPLSKKALHQRDADENLFLRFLELDPPADAPEDATNKNGATSNDKDAKGKTNSGSNANNSNAAASAAAGGGSGGSGGGGASGANMARRHSSGGGKSLGRTPFTMTKKLTRTVERGFGFSIVWTHPPRVEKIEPGLSADRSGILPGDYVIFVDKHNVVTMPEADVLNLIRSQGSTLTLEIFRRSGSGGSSGGGGGGGGSSSATRTIMNGKTPATRLASNASSTLLDDSSTTTAGMAAVTPAAMMVAASTVMRSAPSHSCGGASFGGVTDAGGTVAASAAAAVTSSAVNLRPSTACSGTSSIEAAKRRLNLPQVTFSKESIAPITDNRRRFLLQLISREQNFISALHFGMQRFVQPLQERKDLISPNDHRTLFQNIDELLRISEDILEQLCNDEQEPQMNFASRVYLSKTTAICAAYKKYCNGIKRADCVLVNKSRQAGSEFVAFITEPQVPRKRPDLTMFIHRPLQHFREILKLMQLLASNCHVDSEEHKNFSSVINELQAAYRDITVTSGLMEPLGEGRPLLTLQDLESRMVFTKCKPFTLAVQGRQWIFGGDLSRVEGRSVKPYWTLLFSDIIVFAKVSRDRVLFITEEPIPIANIVDSCFHMRKKTTEFRITVDPNGRLAESPTGYCAPDLTRTPKKSGRRKSLVLRAPSLELKAVWQNLLQRQIFLVNAALGSTPLSSPLDSPDVLNTLVPLSDIGVTSIGSIKHSSMDSINLRNQQQRNQHRHSLNNPSEQIELLIDEKCRILNKTGTSKSNALHLANWMKGQLDKQQEQARLAAVRSRENISREDEHLLYSDSDQDERITYWTRQQLEKRTKELNLVKENGHLRAKPDFGGKRLSGVEELSMSDAHSENISQISQSHSTTSDSQITVRSSPIILDKLAVCRHCHKNCQQQQQSAAAQQQHVRTSATTSPPPLVCNSLKVQHSQSSPHRCCRLNGNASSRGGSVSSISSSTVTGEQPSEFSSKQFAAGSSSKKDGGAGDTESDVAQLITDDLSLTQSEATTTTGTTTTTDESCGAIRSSSSGGGGGNDAEDRSGRRQRQRTITDGVSKLRILEEHSSGGLAAAQGGLVNGHISSGASSLSGASSERKQIEERSSVKPEPPPRKLKFNTLVSSEESSKMKAAAVIITETAKVQHSTKDEKSTQQRPITPKSPKTPTPTSTKKSQQFTACNCKCTPADFEHTTLSPDELEQEICKLIESPKQSPKLPRAAIAAPVKESNEDPHKYCKCVCGNKSTRDERDDDDDLSLMLIGLAQFTPATQLLQMKRPTTTPTPTPTTPTAANRSYSSDSSSFVPTIAVVPPTPDAILTKTTTNIWDNTATTATTITATTTKMHINEVPHQAVIENIPDDSCDESPVDEEPPYRPMNNNSLRRYGTMSSLEKLPSDDRLEDEDGDIDELEDDGDFIDNVNNDDSLDLEIDDDDDDDDFINGKRIERHMLENDDIAVVTREVFGGTDNGAFDEQDDSTASGTAWTSRAGSYVAGKMSFFEESRAFIDKYLGRWNQEQQQQQQLQQPQATATTSDPDEQLDECTSGATSGEEIWGTPTSGGENDEMHLVNSENTHSSPTKSSTSLNDDDDTELMMDELLMAPPMTASTIRGLLPRRRLEPLFEEETESDEEKTQQESEDLKKGETTTNGHDLEDSAGSSSDEELEELDMMGSSLTKYTNEPEEEEEDDEPTSTTEERLHPNLPTTSLGPRPLRQPVGSAGSNSQLPNELLKASSCEYLLEQRSALLTTNSCSNNLHAATAITNKSSISSSNEEHLIITTTTMTQMMTTMTSMTTTMTLKKNSTMNTPMKQTQQLESKNRNHSSITTTINNANDIISNVRDSDCYSKTVAAAQAASIKPAQQQQTFLATTVVRPAAKFIPPPPPPRRLLLTQTDLKTSGSVPIVEPQRNFGASADICSSVDAVIDDGIHKSAIQTQQQTQLPPNCSSSSIGSQAATTTRAAYSIKNSVANIVPAAKRPSSTIIETSLLGEVGSSSKKSISTSSTTVSMMRQQEKPTTTTTTTKKLEPAKATISDRSRAGVVSTSDTVQQHPPVAGCGLSPRLEMRLALNHDILGDEDLICYDPGPDLTTILGHDLSTFQRLTGRDLLNRSATNRVQPREAVISFSQQRNSKMDTPTVNRRPRPTTNSSHAVSAAMGRVGVVQSHLQPNRNTWSNSAYADQSVDVNVSGGVNYKSSRYSSVESNLSDLEILARREKIYCMSQLRSGSPVMMMTTNTMMTTATTTTKSNNSLSHVQEQQQLMRTMSITSMGGQETESISAGSTGSGGGMRVRKIGRDETALIEAGKGNRLINFIKRRNSEVPISPNCSQSSLNESNASSSTPDRQRMQMSPRKDNDKPSLNRRLWKQITKRRRANSVSELVAS